MTGLPIQPGPALTITVDGQPVPARQGQTVAVALLAHGRRVLRHTRHGGKPRGLFCAMGVCFDCVMTIDGKPGTRACMTRVAAGMQVLSPSQFTGREEQP